MAKEAQGTKKVATLEKGTLKRVLGIFDLFAIGYSDLGSSIYYALGVTALFALGATPIALGLAGLVFICTALSYAEMTSMIHESGGSASFARHAFNDLVSFVAGWGLLLDYIVTIAISAFAVGPYLDYFFQFLNGAGSQIGFSVVLIFILFWINFFGVKQSTRISLGLTSFTILIQLVVIIIGFFTLLNLPHILDQLRINVPGADWSPTWKEFWKGTAMAMVAYTGIETIAQLGAETRNPERTVPRAVIFTMFVLILIYLGLSVVALSAISPKDLGGKYILNPVAGIADALPFGGAFLAPCIAVIAAVVLFVAANAGLVGASRLSFNMGEYYQLPRFFYRIQKRYRTPYVSLGFFAAFAIGVVIASRGRMTFLADLYNFGAMIAFTSAHLSLIVLRIKKPHLHRPFRIPFGIPFANTHIPISAIIGCLATTSVWFLIVFTKPEGRILGLTWIAAGLAMYYFYRRKRRLVPTGHVVIEQVKIPGYKQIKISNILVPTRGGMQTETVQMACEIAKTHGAKITAIQIIEIVPSLPLDTKASQRMELAEAVLKRAEAIANEYNVEIELKILRSRSVTETIIEMSGTGHYDLLVLGATSSSMKSAKDLGQVTERILRKAHCRVMVCASKV